MTESDIYAALNEIVRDFFADDSITLQSGTTANDVDGWDSLNNINIMIAAEMRFGIRMTTGEIESLTNVGDLVRTIQAKMARA